MSRWSKYSNCSAPYFNIPYFATFGDIQSYRCKCTQISRIYKECNKFEQSTNQINYFYLPLLSTSFLLSLCIYGRHDEKFGKITTWILRTTFFCDCATVSKFSFLNCLITRSPSGGYWYRYSVSMHLGMHNNTVFALSCITFILHHGSLY